MTLTNIAVFFISLIITVLYGEWKLRKQLRERSKPKVESGMPEPIVKNADHPSNLEPLPGGRIDRAYLEACHRHGVAVMYNDEPRVPVLIYHMDRVGEVVQWGRTSEQELLAPTLQHITTMDVVLRCARRI